MNTMDIHRVMSLLPHRYPFLLIDKVLEFEPDERLLALKNVTYNEPFFGGHFPGRPVMIDKARFKQPVEPGDQLHLEVFLKNVKRGIWMFSGEARVDGRVAATAEIMCTARDF